MVDGPAGCQIGSGIEPGWPDVWPTGGQGATGDMGDVVLGIHLGPAWCQAVYLDRQGRVIARGCAALKGASLPKGGVAEAQLAGCWQAVQQAALAAAQTLRSNGVPARPVALSLAADSSTAVFISHYGVAIAPPAAPSAHELRDCMAAVWESAGWGSDPCTCGYAPVLAAQARWLRMHHPALHAKVGRAGTLRDWLLWRLTGVWATDLASGPGGSLWPAAVALQAGWHEHTLATTLPWDAVAGGLRTGAARDLGLSPSLPVATGSNTGASALLGTGCMRFGAAALDPTGTALTIVAAAPAPGCIGYPLLPGAWAQVIDLAAGADGSLVPVKNEVAAAVADTQPHQCVVVDDQVNRQLLARVLGAALPGTTVTADRDAGARGAALLAMVAAAWHKTAGDLFAPATRPVAAAGEPFVGLRRNP